MDMLKIRANRTTGELEVEGPEALVAEWWSKLWPQLGGRSASTAPTQHASSEVGSTPSQATQIPGIFGEFFSEFRSDITDVDKLLVAAAFVQERDTDKSFNTKTANQLLLDQNVKVANASECVRRLVAMKRAFLVSSGKFRVSATGFEYLKTLRAGALIA